MDEKKKNDMDNQIEAENADVSCSSCPIDSVAQKNHVYSSVNNTILKTMQGFLVKFLSKN